MNKDISCHRQRLTQYAIKVAISQCFYKTLCAMPYYAMLNASFMLFDYTFYPINCNIQPHLKCVDWKYMHNHSYSYLYLFALNFVHQSVLEMLLYSKSIKSYILKAWDLSIIIKKLFRKCASFRIYLVQERTMPMLKMVVLVWRICCNMVLCDVLLMSYC